MKKIVGDLLKNKNIEEHLQEYYGRFMEINNKYAMVRLAMNYYTYYVAVSEDGGMIAPGYQEVVKQIHMSMEHYIAGSDNSDDIRVLEQMRNKIIEKVRDITCFVDRYNIYEHALNRVEYRFLEEDYPAGYSDENFARQIMHFIFEEEDSTIINYKIKDVIGQIPVRLTKNKFFEMLSSGMSIYSGGDKKSLNDFLYMIKTCSMLESTDTMMTNYPHLFEAFEHLKEIKLKEITQSEYEEMKDTLADITTYIDDEMNTCMMVQEILNDLLLMLYTKEHKISDKVVDACDEIVKNTNLLFMDKFSPKSLEEIEEMFAILEGEQEQLYPMITTYDITDEIKESYSDTIEEIGLKEQYNTLFQLSTLNSDSMFAEMKETGTDTEIVDEQYLEERKENMIAAYKALFAENDKMINRAVMSAVLSELPVFFNNISDLQDYIYNMLSNCTDKAEKLACIELINGIMAE